MGQTWHFPLFVPSPCQAVAQGLPEFEGDILVCSRLDRDSSRKEIGQATSQIMVFVKDQRHLDIFSLQNGLQRETVLMHTALAQN